MSNPTTGVWQLASTLTGAPAPLVGVEPIRYDSGLWLEEAGANLIINPWFAVDTTGWNGLSGVLTRDTGWAYRGPASGKMVASASVARMTMPLTLPAVTHTATFVIYHLLGSTRSFTLFYNNANVVVVPVASGVPTVVSSPITGSATPVSIQIRLVDSVNGETFWVGYADVRTGSYRTSPVPDIDAAGTIKPGYAWDSTPHASPSTRAASSASISPAGILSPDTGSLAFRFRRLIDTGGIETLLECGTAGSGTDYLSISVNSSDKLVVSWNSDNAGAQTVTSTESIAVDTEYFVYTEWASGTMGLSIDNGDLVVGARDAVEGDWGVGELVLEAK